MQRRRYDWERGDWDAFRPESFHPLDSQERINRHLSMECEINSAMPGSEESLKLAQKLGIGRFVPCFLLFSDIGNPTVRLFPVAHQRPEQIFDRLRSWIDSFYEINNATLSRWAEIEQRIKDACEKFQTPIRQVDQWKAERQERWQSLQRLSQHLKRLTDGSPSIQSLKEINGDWNLAWETRKLIEPFLDRFEEAERKQKFAKDLSDLVSQLRATTNPLIIQSALLQFRERNGEKLSGSLEGLFKEATSAFKPAKLRPPKSQIWEWWGSEFGRPLSRNRHSKYRAAWADRSKAKYGLSAVGEVAGILKDEYELILRTAFAQTVSCVPEQAAEETINNLAAHLDVQPNDLSWNEGVASYRKLLVEYFANLKSHAPSWIIDMGSRLSPVLCWGDCVPLHDQRQAAGLKQCLNYLPRLNNLTMDYESGWDATVCKIETQWQEQQRQSTSKLTEAIDEWISSASLVDSDRQSTWLTLVSTLSRARRDLEDKIFESAKNDVSAPYPGKKFSRNDAANLLRLLEEYDRSIRSIKYPFETDREVLTVALETSLPAATGIAPEKPLQSAAERAKAELTDAVQAAEKSVDQWDGVKQEASKWNPVGMLCASLDQVLNERRFGEVLVELDIKSRKHVNDSLATQPQVVHLLDALSVQELLALERHVYRQNPAANKSPATTKQELHDSILLGIGLLPLANQEFCDVPKSILASRLETIKEKVKRGAFDVFLAHNSQDKPLVMRLGQQLRNQGILPWIDVEQIPPGRWFQDVIQSAVRSVRVAAIVIGSTGIGPWQALELRAFVSRCVENGIPLIPVLFPGVTKIPEELVFLREANCVKFTNDITEDEGISRLIWGITGEKP